MREIVLRREVFPIVEQHRALADVARRRSSAVSSSHPGDPGEKGRKGSWGPAYIKGGKKKKGRATSLPPAPGRGTGEPPAHCAAVAGPAEGSGDRPRRLPAHPGRWPYPWRAPTGGGSASTLSALQERTGDLEVENYAPSPSRLRPGLRYHRATSAGGGKVRGGLTSDTYLCEGLLSTHFCHRSKNRRHFEADVRAHSRAYCRTKSACARSVSSSAGIMHSRRNSSATTASGVPSVVTREK